MTIEEIKNYIRRGQSSLSDNDYKTLFNNLTESTNTLGNWYTVIREGNDYKYGRRKVNLDNMTWRGLSFDEFYGGGIVD